MMQTVNNGREKLRKSEVPRIETVIDSVTGEHVRRDTSKPYETPQEIDDWIQERANQRIGALPSPDLHPE